MRFLPFSFTRGPMLTALARAVAEDPRRRGRCAYCGGAVPIRPDIAQQIARCPGCWRRQIISSGVHPPAPLPPDAYAALRRTTRWTRRWPKA